MNDSHLNITQGYTQSFYSQEKIQEAISTKIGDVARTITNLTEDKKALGTGATVLDKIKSVFGFGIRGAIASAQKQLNQLGKHLNFVSDNSYAKKLQDALTSPNLEESENIQDHIDFLNLELSEHNYSVGMGKSSCKPEEAEKIAQTFRDNIGILKAYQVGSKLLEGSQKKPQENIGSTHYNKG